MIALASTLPPMPGEPPHGLASRLARLHGLPAQAFCMEMGLGFQGVIDGRGAEIDRLASLAGCSPSACGAHAFRREAERRSLRGQALERETIRRTDLHVCPACLQADVRGSSLPPGLAAYVRAGWMVAPLRTCAGHGMALVRLDAAPPAGAAVHDLAARIAPRFKELGRMADGAQLRPASSLELYLAHRIEQGAGGHPWLDGLAFHVAAKACEMIGAVALFGRTPNLDALGSGNWQAAGAAGFAIAKDGPPGVRGFLDRLQSTYPHSNGAERPQALFGRLYQWLAFSARDPAHDPVRALVREHVIETMPVGPGDEVLGEPVRLRKVHSIRSAAIETGRHPKPLRRLLRGAGLIPDGLDAVMDNLVTFPADAAAPLLADSRLLVNQEALRGYLNAPRVHAEMLVRLGLIAPHIRMAGGRSRRHAFHPDELDRFLDGLLAGAVPTEPSEAMRDIPSAAKRANCGAAEIIRLIQEGSLGKVGRAPGVDGYLSILVDVAQVRAATAGPPLDGFPEAALPEALGVSWKAARALIRRGVLATEPQRHPVKRCLVQVVRPAVLAAFEAEHVPLFRLAKERGVHPRRLNAQLAKAGVRPSLDPADFSCTFYRRSDL